MRYFVSVNGGLGVLSLERLKATVGEDRGCETRGVKVIDFEVDGVVRCETVVGLDCIDK